MKLYRMYNSFKDSFKVTHFIIKRFGMTHHVHVNNYNKVIGSNTDDFILLGEINGGINMVNIIDKIGEQIFNFNFWREYERPIRKSMKKVDKYMDEAIDSLERAMAECPDDDWENEEEIAEMSGTEFDEGIETEANEVKKEDAVPEECELWKTKYGMQKKIIQEQEQLIKEMQDHIDDLEQLLDDAEFKICTTMEQFLRCIAKGQEQIVMEGDLYKLWKRYLRAAIKKKTSQTVNISGDWNVTFGYGDNLIILSVPYKGRNTVGVYRAEINTSARNIVFSRVK